MFQTVDLVGGPLTQTDHYDDQNVTVTKPYLNMGLSLLAARPQPGPVFKNRFFIHFRPFTVASWVFAIICTCGVSLDES